MSPFDCAQGDTIIVSLYTFFITLLFFVLGLCIGSFGNVLISRIPKGQSPVGGRSECPKCKKQLGPVELVPLISYCFLLGKCKACRTKIALLYPLGELFSGLLFVWALLLSHHWTAAMPLAIALWLLFVIAIIDLQTQMISDGISIPFIVVSGVYMLSLGHIDIGGLLVGVGFFGGLWVISSGKWIGSGDILLGAGIGLLMGSWQMMLMLLGITYVVGSLIVSGLLLAKKISRKSYVAFGPFLFLGTLITIALHQKVAIWIELYL